jgi:hypothetical protein
MHLFCVFEKKGSKVKKHARELVEVFVGLSKVVVLLKQFAVLGIWDTFVVYILNLLSL